MHTPSHNGFSWVQMVATAALSAALIVGVGCALVAQPGVQAVASVAPAVSPERLRAHVEHLATALWPRSYEQANSQRAAEYVYAQFESMGLKPRYQAFNMGAGSTQRNVIVRFGGAAQADTATAQPDNASAHVAGQTRAGVIVVGAHVDSHGDHRVRPPTPASHTPGADDNASGVAGLIELARLLAAKPPAHPVELVAYATEEPPHFAGPLMGSAVHAASLRGPHREAAAQTSASMPAPTFAPTSAASSEGRASTQSATQSPADAPEAVRLMLSLEMIGYFSDAADSQRYPINGLSAVYGKRGDFLALIAPFSVGDMQLIRRVKALAQGATPLPINSLNASAFVPGVDFSDHRNYWALGMPAILVTDTSFMRNPNYHLASDTPDTLDYTRMAEVVKAVYAVVMQY